MTAYWAFVAGFGCGGALILYLWNRSQVAKGNQGGAVAGKPEAAGAQSEHQGDQP